MSVLGRMLIAVLATIFSVASGYPYDIEVSKIRATSAVFHWKSTEILVETFLIDCAGTQYYVKDGTQVHNTEVHLRSQHVPKGLHNVIIGDLRPNYNYTCYITEKLVEDKQVFNGVISKPVTFCTDYGAPEEPQPPTIIKKDGITYIKIFKPLTTKFGPITGYKLQFHYMDDSTLGDISIIDREWIDPFGKLSPVSVEYSRMSSQPMSFQISYNRRMPNSIFFANDLMNGALKNGFRYRVVTVVYTECRNSAIMFTPSRPSDSFVAVGIDQKSSFSYHVSEEKQFRLKIIIAGTITLPFICLLYMCCIGILLIFRERYLDRKLRTESHRNCLNKISNCVWRYLYLVWFTCRSCSLPCSKSHQDPDFYLDMDTEHQQFTDHPEMPAGTRAQKSYPTKPQQTDFPYDSVYDHYEPMGPPMKASYKMHRHPPSQSNSKTHEYVSKPLPKSREDHHSHPHGKWESTGHASNLHLITQSHDAGHAHRSTYRDPSMARHNTSEYSKRRKLPSNTPKLHSLYALQPDSQTLTTSSAPQRGSSLNEHGSPPPPPPREPPPLPTHEPPPLPTHRQSLLLTQRQPPAPPQRQSPAPPQRQSPPPTHRQSPPPPPPHGPPSPPHGPPSPPHEPPPLPPPRRSPGQAFPRKIHHQHPPAGYDSRRQSEHQESMSTNTPGTSRSPQFEDANGAQTLHYTTSASGVFNTAEEFNSQLDSDAEAMELQKYSSDSMFIPRGLSGRPGSPNDQVIYDSSSQSQVGVLGSAVEVLH